MNKTKIILSSTVIIISLTLLGNYFWFRINVGTLEVKENQYHVIYRLDDSETIYDGDKTFERLKIGKHIIHASENKDGYFFSRDYELNITRGNTTQVEIRLDPKETNPDVSGEEYGF